MRDRFRCTPASAGAMATTTTGASVFLLLTLAVTPTYAQEEVQLQEIVVTAQRRAESVQDVPVSVAAYGQADITRLAIANVEDVTRFTPGLAVNYGGAYAPVISIRGVAAGQGAATTGIYLDDTPIQVRQIGVGGSNVSAYPTVFDLERIEVLRGPQGTLFGAGSEGGAVRFITPEPSMTAYRGHELAELGFNTAGAPSYQLGGAFGGPLLGDRLAFRVSAYLQEDGGWIDRRPYPTAAVTDRNFNSVRTTTLDGALAWAITDSLTVTPKVFFQNLQSGGPPYYWRGLSNPASGDLFYGGLINRPARDEFTLPSLKVEWRAGYVTLTSNTSYLDRTRTFTDDDTFVITEILTGNFTGPHALAPSPMKNPQTQFTQEIRLQSADARSALKWVVGAFYQTVNQKVIHPTFQPDLGALTEAFYGATVEQTFGVPILPDGDIFLNYDTSRDTQKAAFAQVDIRPWDKLTATAGLRYAKMSYRYTNFQDGPFNGGPTGSSGSSSSSFTSPKFGLDYKPGNGLMLYTSAAKGFRPGAANIPVSKLCAPDLAALGFAVAPLAYAPDQVWSYEVGAKGDSLGKRFRWDASVYQVKWSQRQTGTYLPGCGATIVTNVGTAVSKGFELQTQYAVSEHLTLESSLGYDDAYISQTVPIVGTPQNIVTQGEVLGTPAWRGFVSAEYEFAPLPNNTRMYVQGDDSYSSSYSSGSPRDRLYDPAVPGIEAINILSVRVGIRRGSWEASVFTKNLLNAHPLVGLPYHVNVTSDRFEDGSLAPRVIGIRGVYTF